MAKVPKPHQLEGAAWIRARKKCILAYDMRLGKTLTAALAYQDKLPLLILCPKSARLVWRDELLELMPGLKIQIIRTRAERCNPRADVWIMNYDMLGYVKPRRPAAMILDECHRLKNVEAKRTAKAQSLMMQIKYVLALSGTPMPSRPIELWPVLFGLNIVRLDYKAFAFEFADGYYDEYGALIARGASNLDRLQALMAPHILVKRKADVLVDYREPERRIITFDREPEEWESQYNAEELFKHPNPYLALEGLSELLKLSALKKVEDAVEFIIGLLETEPKVIVFAYHKDVIDALAAGLHEYNPVTLTGKSSGKQREFAEKQFVGNPECRVFIGNIISAGEAIDLSVADVSVFVETTWVPKDINQAINRTESMSKLGSASQAYFLTTEASLDHYMLRRIMDKQRIIDKVIVPTTGDITGGIMATEINEAVHALNLIAKYLDRQNELIAEQTEVMRQNLAMAEENNRLFAANTAAFTRNSDLYEKALEAGVTSGVPATSAVAGDSVTTLIARVSTATDTDGADSADGVDSAGDEGGTESTPYLEDNTASAEEYKLEDIRAMVVAKSRVIGRDKAKAAILEISGAEKLENVDKQFYPALVEFFKD